MVLNKQSCLRCGGGGGYIRRYKHIINGRCFYCNNPNTKPQTQNAEKVSKFAVYQRWDDPKSKRYTNGLYVKTLVFIADDLDDALDKFAMRWNKDNSPNKSSHYYIRPET